MSREVRIPKPHATLLRSQASSCHYKYTRIIENRQWGTSVPDDIEQGHIKMIGQTENEHLGISFIHNGHAVNFHHELCMV
jgi:hypothetical protein